jgi:lipid A ethanolaminephosphotransferase
MFSVLTRDDYSDKKAKSQESVLDVIHHAGVPVFWRDNNSSCKGTCDRVDYENIQQWTLPELCNSRECFDNALLHEMDEKLAAMQGPNADKLKVIVLHPKGSHGPDYYNRYPEEEEVFKPACHTNQLSDCTQQEVINAFDNTIHYTDQFLAKTIAWLKASEGQYNTAMIYLSDHGESLGEKGLYLHGMPYMLAPEEQKHVPMFMWFSPGYEQEQGVDRSCLEAKRAQAFSHDNLFHTLLGLASVNTSVYEPELDILQGCKK